MIPFSYNMVDMGGIDLAEANRTIVPGIYEKITEAMNACGDVILYNWKFAGIEIVPSPYSILQLEDLITINGLIQVTELDQITVIGLPPPIVPVEPLDVTSNGTYSAQPPASGFNPVRVAVPPAVIRPKRVTENGVYFVPEGVDGFNPVDVEVEGGYTILFGTDVPTAEYGEDGNIYLRYIGENLLITNIRMVIYAVRSYNSDTQIAEIQLLDGNGVIIDWDEGEATSNGAVYTQTQTPIKAFDNITNDKWYTNTIPSLDDPVWIDFAPSVPIPLDEVSAWQWWTGGDSIGRDPITFELMLSFDGGANFFRADYIENASITTNRNSLAYTHAISAPNPGEILFAYCKVDGSWQNLIGTNINDVLVNQTERRISK